MKSQLLTSYNAEVLFQNKVWSIEKYYDSERNKFKLALVKDKFFTYFPIQYDNNTIGFDQLPPEYIVKKVERFYKTLN